MQVKEYLKHGVIQNSVNVPSVTHEEYLLLTPYVTLAERLGSFLAQISESSLESISHQLHRAHHRVENGIDPQRRHQGHPEVAGEEKANLVNAASLAAERGLPVQEERKPRSSTGGAGSVLSISHQNP